MNKTTNQTTVEINNEKNNYILRQLTEEEKEQRRIKYDGVYEEYHGKRILINECIYEVKIFEGHGRATVELEYLGDEDEFIDSETRNLAERIEWVITTKIRKHEYIHFILELQEKEAEQ